MCLSANELRSVGAGIGHVSVQNNYGPQGVARHPTALSPMCALWKARQHTIHSLLVCQGGNDIIPKFSSLSWCPACTCVYHALGAATAAARSLPSGEGGLRHRQSLSL